MTLHNIYNDNLRGSFIFKWHCCNSDFIYIISIYCIFLMAIIPQKFLRSHINEFLRFKSKHKPKILLSVFSKHRYIPCIFQYISKFKFTFWKQNIGNPITCLMVFIMFTHKNKKKYWCPSYNVKHTNSVSNLHIICNFYTVKVIRFYSFISSSHQTYIIERCWYGFPWF